MKNFVEGFIAGFLALPENNNLGPLTAGKAWDGFLVGYSSGADELYPFLKRHIGEFHFTPAEAFALGRAGGATPGDPDGAASLPGPGPAPEELTVISWALCQTEQAKAANRRETYYPSEPWARSRIFGQRGNRALHRALAKALTGQGHPAVAPALLPEASERESAAWGRASTWSERHVAYISGLGTFSLCGGLITERGQAVRLGSLVVHAQLPPTPRPYHDPFAYCLYYTHGSCRSCVDRCPVASVRVEGRDKEPCIHHLDVETTAHVKREYGFEGYGCGLCQTGVPCESRIPEAPPGGFPR